MFGNPQDIVAMIAAASLIFGSGGAMALRRSKGKPTPADGTSATAMPPSPTAEAQDLVADRPRDRP